MFFQSAFQIIMCCKSLSTFIFKVNLKLDFIENLTLFLDCFMSSASCSSHIIRNSQRTPGCKLRITKQVTGKLGLAVFLILKINKQKLLSKPPFQKVLPPRVSKVLQMAGHARTVMRSPHKTWPLLCFHSPFQLMAYSWGELTRRNENKLPPQLENHTEAEGTRDVFQIVPPSFAWGERSSASAHTWTFPYNHHHPSWFLRW